MFKFLNVHPKGKNVGDCVKRAITTAAQMDYMEVQRQLNRHKKITLCDSYNNNKNCESFVETILGAERIMFPAVKGKPRMNGERFCEAYPSGRYILRMAKHWTCCVDGVIYDTWNCTDKCVYKAWRMKG